MRSSIDSHIFRVALLVVTLSTVALLFVASPAGADWLITAEGKLIETRGEWTIEGRTLTYVDLEGEAQTLKIKDVDLEASAETTAIKAGRPYEPGKATSEAAAAAKAAAGDEKPRIILYMTSLCRNCSLARKLLEDLGVAFVEKDINTDRKAARQYKKKAGHGGGLPVLDIGGRMVFSYNPRVIRQRVAELEEEDEETDDDEADG